MIDEGELDVSGSDEMSIGVAIASRQVLGDGEFTVDGANAVVSFDHVVFSVNGGITVTGGDIDVTNAVLLDAGGAACATSTVLVSGGTITVALDKTATFEELP